MPDINIGEFSEALNNKMDLDGNNSNPPIAHMSDITGGIDISQLEQDILDLQNEVKKMLGRPDYSAGIETTLRATYDAGVQSYTIPSDGFIYIKESENTNHSTDNAYGKLKFNDTIVNFPVVSGRLSTLIPISDLIPVTKDDVITVTPPSTISTAYVVKISFIFLPQR